MSKRDNKPSPFGSSSLHDVDADVYGSFEGLPAINRALAVKDGTVQIGNVTVTHKGLQFAIKPDEMTADEYGKLGEVLKGLNNGIQWAIGDWLVFGAVIQWGELQDVANAIGIDYDLLRNYMTVSRAFNELSLRNDNLSYSHHVALQGFSHEQKEHWLKEAEENKWTVAQLREKIRPLRAKNTNTPEHNFSLRLTDIKNRVKLERKKRNYAVAIEYARKGAQLFESLEREIQKEMDEFSDIGNE